MTGRRAPRDFFNSIRPRQTNLEVEIHEFGEYRRYDTLSKPLLDFRDLSTAMMFVYQMLAHLIRPGPVSRGLSTIWYFFHRLRAGTKGSWIAVVRDPTGRLLTIARTGPRHRLPCGPADARIPISSQVSQYLQTELPGIGTTVPELVAIEKQADKDVEFVFFIQAEQSGGPSLSSDAVAWIEPDRLSELLNTKDRQRVLIGITDRTPDSASRISNL